MATAASIRVIKNFTYRGVTRDFSNRYYFSGGAPTDGAHWTTLSDLVVMHEAAIYAAIAAGGAEIVETVGYAGGSEIPVFTKTYASDGTGGFSGFVPSPGDSAALIRWSTADRSSKNHPVYCFNYYHSVGHVAGVGGQDTVHAQQLAALGVYAGQWIAGHNDGTTNHKRSRPNGDICTGSVEQADITHRDLPH